MKKYALFLLVMLLLGSSTSSAYLPTNTHPLINETAIRSSDVDWYLKNYLNLQKGIEEVVNNREIFKWLTRGGTEEDNNVRGLYHFHDPTKEWSVAGILGIGFSSLLWAQDHTTGLAPDCQNFNVICTESSNPEWSWPATRTYYFQALTSADSAMREGRFGKMFLTLGRVMHLLADATVPEHSRNDAHMVFGSRYESWAELNQAELSSFITQTNLTAPIDYSSIVNISNNPGYSPISNFWDSTFGQGSSAPNPGLSEYTNFNFLSPDTIYKYYSFPVRPQESSRWFENVVAEDGTVDQKMYYSGLTSDGKSVEHFVSMALLWDDLERVSPVGREGKQFILDDKCNKDYASILVAKAVSYDASLLNYFFRGNIEISLPATGVYAQASGLYDGFSTFTIMAQNTSSTGEEMTDGEIKLVIRYLQARYQNPFLFSPVEKTGSYSYIVASAANNQRIISKGTPTLLTFDLTANPLPWDATDVTIQIVYHGQLGNEAGAVVVGYKDISEPTPVDIFNDMSMICIREAWYTAGSAEAIAQVDTNGDGVAGTDEWDVYPHDVEIYIRFSPDTPNPPPASPTDYNFHVSRIYANPDPYANPPQEDLSRIPVILTDYSYSFSFYFIPKATAPNDHWTHNSWWSTYAGEAIKNQTEYTTDPVICQNDIDHLPPCYHEISPAFCTYRGHTMWWGSGVFISNAEYPYGTVCSYVGISSCPVY